MSNEPILRVEGISVSYRRARGWQRVLSDVSLSVQPGEVYGLVGESGCGKSTLAYQMLAYRHPNARVDGGGIRLNGVPILDLERSTLEDIRGRDIGFVAQNPTTALNPGMIVGSQIVETLLRHRIAGTREKAQDETLSLFEKVGLPGDKTTYRKYPHQLSGGQQQRVAIAMAICCKPSLIVLDEPTTGLDVTTQRQIIDLLNDLRQAMNISIVYVTHDLLLLREIADKVAVMYAGRIVETGPIQSVFSTPQHPYSIGLINSVPQITEMHADGKSGRALRGLLERDSLPNGCPFQPRCDFAEAACAENVQVLEPTAPGRAVACHKWKLLNDKESMPGKCDDTGRVPASARTNSGTSDILLKLQGISISYNRSRGVLGRLTGAAPIVVVPDLALEIHRGQTLALIGESGSGKSTIAKMISGLLEPLNGNVTFEGESLATDIRRRTTDQRRTIQYIFQNPDASLNPRMRIREILTRPASIFFGAVGADADEMVLQALRSVQLDEKYADRFPDEVSGGERQRIAIARALIAKPAFLLCDEILSALDVSVQARVLALLRDLKRDLDVAMLFISHDLTVVRSLADRVAVLFRGVVVETGDIDSLFRAPFHPYTQSLLLAVPGGRSLVHNAPEDDRDITDFGQTGCVYAYRCPYRIDGVCDRQPPPVIQDGESHELRCHLTRDELVERTAPQRQPNDVLVGQGV